MNDIERLLSASPDLFEKRMFHIENELHFLEKQIGQDARIAAALDRAFDDLLNEAVADCADDAEFAETRTQIRTMRGYRLSNASNEQLAEQMTRIFGQLHELHSLYRECTP